MMFKALGNLLYKTPWSGLVVAGIAMLLMLVLFALPVNVIRLMDSGTNPAENRAIQREIGLAVGERALDLATSVLTAMQARSTDPERRRQIAVGLAEVARARVELARAKEYANSSFHFESAQEGLNSAVESAADAADSALDAATEALEALQAARMDALERLHSRGPDAAATALSFDLLITAAKDNERLARESQAALRAALVPAPALQGATPQVPRAGTPVAPSSAASSAVTIGIRLPGSVGMQLSPELRGDIHAKVGSDVWRVTVGSILILAFIPLYAMLMIGKFFINRSRNAMALAERKTREAEVSNVSRQVTEARLQALQAQVEPHFLYNTLANVQALTEVDPPAANQMVGHLIQYLRSSLPKMRESTSTVGQELDLVRAYLNILQMRMGDRLAFAIDADAALLSCAFAPMMLPTLVENAIKHGLEPQRQGGRIDVVVRSLPSAMGKILRVEVRDTGRGLRSEPKQPGAGVGLSNLRERLAAMYGERARFTLVSNDPAGVVATIDVPQQAAPLDAASTFSPDGEGTIGGASRLAEPVGVWNRFLTTTRTTHRLWAHFLTRTFLVLLVLLMVLFGLGFAGLLTGWLPVHMGDLQLDGVEGLAVGSVGLLVGFGVAALGTAIVLTLVYGIGFLLAGVVLLVIAVILISTFPALAPFALIGLVLWWLIRKPKA